MFKMDSEALHRLTEEYQQLNDRIIKIEDKLRSWQKGEEKFCCLDDIHLLEEQLHYMRGYARLLKIRLYQQGVNV